MSELAKRTRDGKVAVLVSPRFGAGWSTWNTVYPQMLFDPVIVDRLLAGEKIDTDDPYLEETYPDAYFGGLRDLEVQWLPAGTVFYVDEYDGSEALRTADTFKVA